MKRLTLVSGLMLSSCLTALHAMENVSPKTKSGLLLFRMKDALLVQSAVAANENRALTLLSLPGINLNFKEGNGRTALHYAAEQGLFTLAQELIAKGADISTRDKLGDTPLTLAQDNDQAVIANLLKK